MFHHSSPPVDDDEELDPRIQVRIVCHCSISSSYSLITVLFFTGWTGKTEYHNRWNQQTRDWTWCKLNWKGNAKARTLYKLFFFVETLQEANAGFRSLLSKSTQQLKALAKKLGNSIEKSRPYHDAYDEYKTAQEKCQEAAVQFQRAFGIFDLLV